MRVTKNYKQTPSTQYRVNAGPKSAGNNLQHKNERAKEHMDKYDNRRLLRECQNNRPVVNNLSAPPTNDIQGLSIIKGTSSSPSQLIRTLVYFPSTKISSNKSSTVSPLSPLSPVLHLPLRGRSPTKYTRIPEISEIKVVRSLTAQEKAILSSWVRMVIGP